MATCSGIPEVDFSKFTQAFAAIGGLTVAYAGFKALLGLYHLLSTYVFSGTLDVKKYGAWAVITGATDGIGKAYAQELARRGLNIVLISRTQEKLQDVANELETLNSGIKTKVIAADFTKGWELKETLRAGLKGLDIGILVNNVGMGYGYPEFFLDVPNADQAMRDLMNVNVISVLMMTQVCVPSMVDKKRGLVINISSAAGFRPTPMLTLYSASKAFVDFFSEAMNKEYSRKGIKFQDTGHLLTPLLTESATVDLTCLLQSVMPYFVATKLSKIRRATLWIPSANDFVRSALSTAGRVSRTTGYLPHQIQYELIQFIPDWLLDRQVMKLFLIQRRKALKRLEEKKAD